jgi:hypothetical protein
MFKVTFTWQESMPTGGASKHASGFELFDADTASELKARIDHYIRSQTTAYRTHIKAVEVSRL